MKKAWLRRSLTQDLKQKARMTSSGGSCYYGGMMSHTTTHSVSLSAANPRSLSFTGGGAVGSSGPAGGGSLLRPPRQQSLYPQSNLPGYVLEDTKTSDPQQELPVRRPGGKEVSVFSRHARASRGNHDSKSQGASPAQSPGAEEPDSSLSVKELETTL